MIVKVYVYDNNGVYQYEDTGQPHVITADLEDRGFDFTLQPPPNYSERWRWDGLQWIKDDSPDN